MADRLVLPEDGSLRGARLRIDLRSLVSNFHVLSRAVAPAVVGAIVKADAYGHGALKVAEALEAQGCETFFVALAEEGAALRQAGVEAQIVVLGVSRPAEYSLYREYDLTGTLSSLEQIDRWKQDCQRRCWVQPVHVKIDTGLTRLGLSPEQLLTHWPSIRKTAEYRVEGFFSHFAESEALESQRNQEQERLFLGVLEQLPADDLAGLQLHMANSGAALSRSQEGFSVVRTGLALYGYDPTGAFLDELEPVLSVESEIVRVLEVPPGTQVGYGGEWRTSRRSQVATVPVGYADGFPQSVGDRAEALVGGRRVPVVGAVSMDMLCLDVTDTSAAPGDVVVLLGAQGREAISGLELAAAAQTSVYEILCRLGRQRLPRVFEDADHA